MKIRPVGAELFHAYRQTDRMTNLLKLIIAFCSCLKAPHNENKSKTNGLCFVIVFYTVGESRLLWGSFLNTAVKLRKKS